MFERFRPEERAVSQTPTFEELMNALPEELQKEFQDLGESIEKINAVSGSERIVEDELLSEEEKRIFARHGELQAIAMANLEGNKK